MTAIECIIAAEACTWPVIILRGQNLETTWFNDNSVSDYKLAVCKKGWTSNFTGAKWLNEMLIPEIRRIRRNGREAARMQTLDGHGSHVHVDFLSTCKINNIQWPFLSPQWSHILQPLDLGILSPLQSRYRSRIQNLCILDNSATITKRPLVEVCYCARNQTFTLCKLKAVLAALGLFCWRPSKALSTSQNRNCQPLEQLPRLTSNLSSTTVSLPVRLTTLVTLLKTTDLSRTLTSVLRECSYTSIQSSLLT